MSDWSPGYDLRPGRTGAGSVPRVRRDWLERVTEEIVDPDLPIIDPHHHLWPYPIGSFGQYDLSQLHRDTGAGHRVVATVFVECGACYRDDGPEYLRVVGETEWVAEVADQSAANGAAIAGIVGSADLRLGEQVDDVLAAHEAAGRGRFRGIRHRTNHDPLISGDHDAEPAIMRDPRFVDGMRRLAAGGYTFDAWSFHNQIPELIEVARAVPEATIVSNHLAGPVGVGPYADDRRGSMAHWRELIAELADCPNVVLKLGGIGGWASSGSPGTNGPTHRPRPRSSTPGATTSASASTRSDRNDACSNRITPSTGSASVTPCCGTPSS